MATDGTVNSAVATVMITVNPVNDPPVAVNDSYATDEDTALVVIAALGVLDNDFDIDPNPLTASLVATTTNGVLVLNPDGSLTYTPAQDFNGSDSFTYVANDGTVNSLIATVTITVNPINDPPVAVNDTYATDEDTPLTVTASVGVLDNDTDVELDTLSAVIAVTTTNGALALNADGSFTYTPNQDFNGTDSFTYFANDGTDPSASPATVTITVNPVNDAPVANADAYPAFEDTPLSIAAPGVLTNDTDVDPDTLTAVIGTSTSNGLLALNADGSFTYTPNLNFNGTDSFTYTANDGAVNSAPATVTITVAAVNDPPTFVDGGNPPTIVENSGPQAVPAWATAISPGPPDEAAQNLVFIVTMNGSTGTLTFATAPAVSTATGNLTYTASPATNGTATFEVVLQDDGGGADTSAPVVFTIEVLPTPTVVYVDDDWTTNVYGDDPDGAGPATVLGIEAFAMIQQGVNAVATGGTVNVADGT
jgi:VCBS repeat-containing protein